MAIVHKVHIEFIWAKKYFICFWSNFGFFWSRPDQTTPNDSKWVKMALNSSKWLQMAPNGSKWLQMAWNDSKWLIWLQMAPNGFKRLQMAPNRLKWLQIAENGSNGSNSAKKVPKMSKTCQKKVPKGATKKKAKVYNNRKMPKSTPYICWGKTYLKKCLNCYELPKIARPSNVEKCHKVLTCNIKKCKKYQKGPKSFLNKLIYETTMSSMCHRFGQIDYNGGSPVW